MSPPANWRRYEMIGHLVFLPLIIVTLDVKVKVIIVRIIRKTIVRKMR
jgi:hypothetical protein